MGATNVARVFTAWAHLTGNEFKVLAYAALITLDSDEHPEYWGGWEALAGAIGRTVPPEPARDDQSAHAETVRDLRTNAAEAVKVAVRGLVKKGAMTEIARARAGRNAVYGLILEPASRKGNPSQEGRISPDEGKDFPGEGEGKPFPQRGRGGRGTTEEDISSQGDQSPALLPTFARALSLLTALPDRGATYLARVEDDTGQGAEPIDLRTHYVLAAHLLLTEHPAQPDPRKAASDART